MNSICVALFLEMRALVYLKVEKIIKISYSSLWFFCADTHNLQCWQNKRFNQHFLNNFQQDNLNIFL